MTCRDGSRFALLSRRRLRAVRRSRPRGSWAPALQLGHPGPSGRTSAIGCRTPSSTCSGRPSGLRNSRRPVFRPTWRGNVKVGGRARTVRLGVVASRVKYVWLLPRARTLTASAVGRWPVSSVGPMRRSRRSREDGTRAAPCPNADRALTPALTSVVAKPLLAGDGPALAGRGRCGRRRRRRPSTLPTARCAPRARRWSPRRPVVPRR